MRKISILTVFAMLFVMIANATIINVPADITTIQGGINGAVNGDTVLVQPGTYVENINFNGKNITVASLFLITQDTSYISQTIIDGNQNGSVVIFESGEDTTFVLMGITITNGYAQTGGGIYCRNSSPRLENVKISFNSAYQFSGGGIYCSSSSPILENVTIANNSAINGGGIYFNISGPSLANVTIANNSAEKRGGGIYCYNSSPSLDNVTISNNSAYWKGGGIYCINSIPVFSIENRCNVYLNNVNNRGRGSDIYTSEPINVIVDTFTVLNPTDFHASPIENFTFDILHGIQNQVNSDLFVSPEGDNSNSGLSAEVPLKTIQYACSIISSDSLNPHTIYLSEGTYSFSTNGEFLPISLPDYISLTGESEDNVILDAEGFTGVMRFEHVENVIISNLTIRNGDTYSGGGIYCNSSITSLNNITIADNSSDFGGGGIYCGNSSMSMDDLNIKNNSTKNSGGGICCSYSSSMSLENVTIENNFSETSGGGIYCSSSSPSLGNVTISNNSAYWKGGGIYCTDSNPILENVSISYNSAYQYSGGGIYCDNSIPFFSSENRCNVYLNNVNNRGRGSDIYSSEPINVIVDTFTVLNPTDFHASPIENFTFDILHGIQNQVNSDLFVSPEGDNSNSGLSAEEPLKTIQYACSIILVDSLNPHTIYLSEGTYSPSTNGEFFTINLPDYISLTGENEDNVILDAEGFNRVMRFDNVENVTISNLTITNGTSFFGGGIYFNYSSPSIVNVTIAYNAANGFFAQGGGIYCLDSNPILENVTIANNSASYGGGGILCDNSNPSLVNVTIENNSAIYGGGILCFYSSPIIENLTIMNNTANDEGGSICLFSSNPIMVNVTMDNNSAVSKGGGIYCSGSSPCLANMTIANNSASHGGGIYCYSSTPSFENVTITNNLASCGGGAIYFRYSSPILSNVTIANNSAGSKGGGIYCNESSPSLINCIMWNDTPEDVYFDENNSPNTITIAYSDIDGGEAGIVTNNNGTVNWLEGNIDANPLFVDAENSDYHLQWGSPCIDSGNPDTIYNDPDGTRNDMGSYYFPHTNQFTDIPEGWTGISSWVSPFDESLEVLFEDIEEQLVILQNSDGFYYPAQNINTLGNWNTQNGYAIKLADTGIHVFKGLENENRIVELNAGWNYLPVISKCDVSVTEVSVALSAMQIIKEVAGWKVYWPEYGINTLEYLKPGLSYFIRLNEAGSFSYTTCESLKSAIIEKIGQDLSISVNQANWGIFQTTLSTHTIAIQKTSFENPEIKTGHFIGAFNEEGQCFGICLWENENTAITLFGDDPTTPEKDGFTEGEPIRFKLYDPTTKNEITLIAEFDPSLPDFDGTFKVNGLSAIKSITAGAASITGPEFSDIRIYPNPAKDEIVLSLGTDIFTEGIITIFKLDGQKAGIMQITENNTIINISHLLPGIYILNINIDGNTFNKRLVKH